MFESDRITYVRVRRRLHKYSLNSFSANCINTMGDCSTISIGGYSSMGDRKEAAKAFTYFLFQQYGAVHKPEGYRWKIILTDEFLDDENSTGGALAAALDEICAESHRVSVNGWTGKAFEIGVWEIEKSFDEQGTWDIPDDLEQYEVLVERGGCKLFNENISILDEDSVPPHEEEW